MPPGPVQSAPSPVMANPVVWAAAVRTAPGEDMPRSTEPLPSSALPTKSRRVISVWAPNFSSAAALGVVFSFLSFGMVHSNACDRELELEVQIHIADGIAAEIRGDRQGNFGHRLLDLLCRLSLTPCLNPSENGNSAQKQHDIEHVKIACRQMADLSIAAEHGVQRGRKTGGSDLKENRNCDVGQVPAETCIIEIDESAGLAVDEDVLGNQVGMDQPKAVARFADFGQTLPRDDGSAVQERALGRGECVEIAVISPDRGPAQAAFFVPAMPMHRLGRTPLLAVEMHLRGQSADLLVGPFNKLFLAEGFAFDAAERYAGHPRQQVALKLTRFVGRRYPRNQIALSRRHDARGGNTVIIQCSHPEQLRTQRRVRVVTAAVHAQNMRGFAINVDCEYRILSILQQPQVCIGCNSPRGQRRPRDADERRAGSDHGEVIHKEPLTARPPDTSLIALPLGSLSATPMASSTRARASSQYCLSMRNPGLNCRIDELNP